MFIAVMGLSFVLINYAGLLLGCGFLLVSVAALSIIQRIDDRLFEILWASWSFPVAFDPAKRDIFELEIYGRE